MRSQSVTRRRVRFPGCLLAKVLFPGPSTEIQRQQTWVLLRAGDIRVNIRWRDGSGRLGLDGLHGQQLRWRQQTQRRGRREFHMPLILHIMRTISPRHQRGSLGAELALYPSHRSSIAFSISLTSSLCTLQTFITIALSCIEVGFEVTVSHESADAQYCVVARWTRYCCVNYSMTGIHHV